MASARTGDALEIRKLRKKLRQIESLERKDRDLTNEELLKLTKKTTIRERLLELLATTADDDGETLTASTRSDVSSKLELDNSTERQSQNLDVSNIEVTMITPEDENDDSLIDVESVEANPQVEVEKDENNHGYDDTQVLSTEWVTPRQPIRNENPQKSTEKLSPSSKTKVSSQSPKKEKKVESNKDTNTSKTAIHFWRQGLFSVFQLEGHNHLITATAVQDSTLVTASRDTTVKMWDLESLTEVRSFGGHTGTVTDVILLSREIAKRICELIGVDTEEKLIISCSLDCSFKIWSTNTGEILKSIYTFNPVTRLVYHPVAEAIVTGSDAGKMEVWDVGTGDKIQSTVTFESDVTGMKVEDGFVYVCSSEGLIKVFAMRERNLACVFVSENVSLKDGGKFTVRSIQGFTVRNNIIYYGDDGINIKVLNWKTGIVHKLKNQCEDFGVTDSLCFHDNVLLSTAYSLDTGLGYVNVRLHPQESYVASLNDVDTERIISLCCSTLKNGSIAVVTAGVELKVWTKVEHQSNHLNEYVVKATYLSKLSNSPVDSDPESEAESDQSEDDGSVPQLQDRRSSKTSTQSQGGWRSWCIIV